MVLRLLRLAVGFTSSLQIGWTDTDNVHVRDLWEQQDIGNFTLVRVERLKSTPLLTLVLQGYSATLHPHDVFFFRATNLSS